MGWGRKRSKWDFKLKQNQLYKMVFNMNRNDSPIANTGGLLDEIVLSPSIAEQVTRIVRDIRSGEVLPQPYIWVLITPFFN